MTDLPERSTTPSRPIWNAKRPSWGSGLITPDIASRSQSTGRAASDHDSTESWHLDKHFLMAMVKEMQLERASLSARLDTQLAAVTTANEQIRELHQLQDRLRSQLDDKDHEIQVLKQCQNNPDLNSRHHEQQLQNRIIQLTESVQVLSERLKTMAEINRNLRLQLADLNSKKSEKRLLLQTRWAAAIIIQKHWRRWIQQQRYRDMLYDMAVMDQIQQSVAGQGDDIEGRPGAGLTSDIFTITVTIGLVIMIVMMRGGSSS